MILIALPEGVKRGVNDVTLEVVLGSAARKKLVSRSLFFFAVSFVRQQSRKQEVDTHRQRAAKEAGGRAGAGGQERGHNAKFSITKKRKS